MKLSRAPLILPVLCLVVFANACGVMEELSQNQVKFGGTCNVKPDQMDSFMAKIETFPTVLTVVADPAFSAQEFAEIQRASQSWNDLGRQISGHSFFKVMQSNIPVAVRNADPRDCAREYTSQNVFYIVKVTSDTTWTSLGFSDSIPGVTVRCAGGKTRFDQQIVFINPSEQIIHAAQIQSVILHEFGHALGLDHSCINEQGRPDYASCLRMSESHPYRQAVMYPSLVKGQTDAMSEIKEILQENDSIRAQCLYSPE